MSDRPAAGTPYTDPCAVADNAEVFGKLLNETGTQTTYNGVTLVSYQDALDGFGFGVAPFTFATGGVLNSLNLLVSNAPTSGLLYKYIGAGSAPITVTAGTNPVGNPNWQAFAATSLQALIGLTEPSDLDKTHRTEATLARISNGDYGVGSKLVISERGGANFNVVAGGTANGLNVLDAGGGNTAVLDEDVWQIEYLVTAPITDATDCLAAANAAMSSGKPLWLRRMYGLTNTLNFPANARVYGDSRATCGFHALPPFGTLATRSVTQISGSNVRLENFKVDAKNFGNGSTIRYNCVAVSVGVKNFHISAVDVYDCTGYGHVTFGTEASADVTGYYEDCYAENCQVPFEQIGALDVTLIRCNALAVAGRTLEIFHPYAGSKRVTYIDCHGTGTAGAGVNIVTTNGYAVGPITFIDSSIDIVSATSAVTTGLTSGANARVDVKFIGGSYKSAGASAAFSAPLGSISVIGSRFDGPSGFNCPAFAAVNVELSATDIIATSNSATGTTYGLITNSAKVKVTGGSITASNSLGGGAQAVLGNANISSQTTLTPAGSAQVTYVATSSGSAAILADGPNGYANILLPLNQADAAKIIAKLSVRRATDAYSVGMAMSWSQIDAAQIRVRIAGLNSGFICYEIGILA